MARLFVALVAAISVVLLQVSEPSRAFRPIVVTTVDAPCASLRGFVDDLDRHGTNIRSAPRDGAPILTRIPAGVHLAGGAGADTVYPILRVIGSHAGWLLVENVSLGDGVRTVYAFAGPGWISGTLVGFSVASRFLHTAPGITAPVRESLFGKDFTPDRFSVARTYGCRGRWAEVELENTAHRRSPGVRGWVGAVCDTQLTTCDNVDLP